jgi:hypothetical protein
MHSKLYFKKNTRGKRALASQLCRVRARASTGRREESKEALDSLVANRYTQYYERYIHTFIYTCSYRYIYIYILLLKYRHTCIAIHVHTHTHTHTASYISCIGGADIGNEGGDIGGVSYAPGRSPICDIKKAIGV